ncbi:CHAT domain-containing protein [Nocardia ninae]|uniref:CHAT domain-containing protein n=1 Tax=Nocardia ninae NBRC 108245 TaxID=1210091 RepID=A0A511MBE0_9NOCA|nr:CHAT domain-containing protein [Nocardia ninae]GEM37983.1 CHAT domain-containing protein [Nocardia ninae NBRC 108245]
MDAATINDRALALYAEFDRTGDVSVLRAMVTMLRDGAAALNGHDDEVMALSNLSLAARQLFELTGDVAMLREAVRAGRSAVATMPPADPRIAVCLTNLGSALRSLFEETGDMALLLEAVQAGRDAVAAAPEDHFAHGGSLSNLAMILRGLFERTGDVAVLEEAVQIGRSAVAAIAVDDPIRPGCLNDFGMILRELFERTGDVAAVQEAARVGREAVSIVPDGHFLEARLRSNLGFTLTGLFERTGDLGVIEEAVRVSRSAVAAVGADDAYRAALASNLEIALHAQFDRTGEVSVIEEAVRAGRSAVDATPPDHPAMARRWSSLGLALKSMYERTGEAAALEEAVHAGRRAVASAPVDHPDRTVCLGNLEITLQRLYQRTKELPILEEAACVSRAALAATEADHRHRSGRLSSLGVILRTLHERTGDPAVIAEAVQLARAGIAATAADDPDRRMYLSNFGGILQRAFERTGELSVLVEAVQVGRDAVAATPVDDPARAGYLTNLALALQRMFVRTKDVAYQFEARDVAGAAATSPTSPITKRIAAGRMLAGIEMTLMAPDAALGAIEAVVASIPQIAPRAWSRHDREQGLGRLAGLASEVCAIAVAAGRPGRAVELLEQTRGLLLNETIEDRTDLTALNRAAPELAAEFDSLRAQFTTMEEVALVSTQPDGGSGGARRASEVGEQRKRALQQWTSLLERIRAVPGFAEFLLPPSASRLRRQADDGAIVMVYADNGGCGALILRDVPGENVESVPLPDLTLKTAKKQVDRLTAALAAADESPADQDAAQRDIHEILGWLWDTIASSVLDRLGITLMVNPRPRIRWCPVGVLAYFPLHAAGHHTVPGRRTVLDRTVSSYITTIRLLERARGRTLTAASTAMIVAMPSTPGVPGGMPLPGVHRETRRLTRLLAGPLILDGPNATHDAVATALAGHSIAHFACHGVSDQARPADSRLLLYDHASAPLTVTALARLDLTSADLAYLSVCSTTHTTAALVDEAIHLTAAIHLAGYRHVIGTLWPINDAAAIRIAVDFYTRLTRNGTQPPRTEDAAYALAEAVRRLRDDNPMIPTRWAAHLHQGV